MRVHGGQLSQNLGHAAELIAEAAGRGADLALLPEALDLGWTHPDARNHGTTIPDGEACAALARAARQHRIFVCAGMTEKDGDRTYNAAVIIDRDGEVILRYRKLNELEIGHASYDQGDRLGVCHTELGTLGLMICADGFASGLVLGRTLGHMGADIILSPSAWAVPPGHDQVREPYGRIWRDSYIPVCREFSLWIAAVSNVGPIVAGPWEGRDCIGCSLVIDPQGEEILRGPYGADAETILYTEVQPLERPARGCGWQEMDFKREVPRR